MKVISNLTLGSSSFQFEVEEKDDKETLLKAIGLATPRLYCNVCKASGADTKALNARKSKTDDGEFTYISVRCQCGASSTLGSYKSGGYFWKEFEAYEVKTTNPKRLERESIEDYTA